MNYSNHPVTKEFRQLLRREETPTERMLWKRLRGKQLDGEVHNSKEAQLHDSDRTSFLNENRIHVIRFRNEEVEQSIEMVIQRIREYINCSINQTRSFRPPTP